MTSEMQPMVEFRSVSYTAGETQILHGLDLRIEQGEVLVLLGESGCGKTTTLKLINRLIDPTGGSVLVEGKSTADWDAIKLRRRIGYVLQDGGLFPHFTIEQNVGLTLKLAGRSVDEANTRTAEMLDLVGLVPEKFADRFPHELSGGQRQRVGVARALAADPPLILLDEPFGALDVITRTNLQKEFARLVRDLGKTAVFVTHDLHEARLLGTRIALMEKGRIVFLGTAKEFTSSNVPLAAAYLETLSD
ncbi:MAG: ATP-binding cassette domain-containing protein [Acidobacteria bacterium]|nr:ATP-binding cassette domain-containing protein [Acidobacteriota bacterium]